MKYIRMGLSEAQYNEDLAWVLSLYDKWEISWEEKMHRWLYGRMMHATKIHRQHPQLDVFDCWRMGRDAEKEVVMFYQAYTMFLRKVQHDIKETYSTG